MSLDRKAVEGRAAQILQIITSQEFLDQLEAVRLTPRERRIEEATRRLTPTALRKAGVNLPENSRISSRYFEEDENFSIELGDPGGRIPIAPALSEVQPDFLDKLRVERPDLVNQILRQPFQGGGQELAPTITVCVCAGVIVCACIGSSN